VHHLSNPSPPCNMCYFFHMVFVVNFPFGMPCDIRFPDEYKKLFTRFLKIRATHLLLHKKKDRVGPIENCSWTENPSQNKPRPNAAQSQQQRAFFPGKSYRSLAPHLLRLPTRVDQPNKNPNSLPS
jgi:hypothetical protein